MNSHEMQPESTPKTTLTDGSPVTEDHREIIHGGARDGQQKGYVVLSEEERAKGFLRPVRTSYIHKPELAGPKYLLRDLTPDEKAGHPMYDKFEVYPESESPVTGRYWAAADLQRIRSGCGAVTFMGRSLAETYARQPNFYSGTFCARCRTHYPVGENGEFVWEGTDERVGS